MTPIDTLQLTVSMAVCGSCGPGTQLVNGACEDVDECMWRPCLHGGSCLNLRPGYLCVCGPGHLGDHCQWSELASNGHPLAAPAAIAAITVSILVLGESRTNVVHGLLRVPNYNSE